MPRKFWTPVLALGLVLVQTISAHVVTDRPGEPDPSMLKLFGEVVDLRLLEEDTNKIRFEVKLRLKLVNDGNEPAILLKQSHKIGAVKLSRTCEEAKAQTYLYQSAAWPSVSLGAEWDRWRQRLDSTEPPPTQVWFLPRGESLSFEASTAIYIEKSGNFDKTNKPWDEIRSEAKVLQVQIQIWPRNLEPKRNPEGPEFGQTLQKRWKSFGRLQLDLLTSEPIQLMFPR